MIETAAAFTEEDLTRYLQLTLDLFQDASVSSSRDCIWNSGLIKLVQVGRLQAIEEAIAKWAARQVARATAPAPRNEKHGAPCVKVTAAPAHRYASHWLHGQRLHPSGTPSLKRNLSRATAQTGDLKTDLHSALIGSGD